MNPVATTPVELRLARRMGRLSGEPAFEVLHEARLLEAKGHDIVHLEIGESDFDPRVNIMEAGITAMREGFTHYTPAAVMIELREAAAEDIRKTRGIPCTAEEGVVVPGAKPTVFFSFMALVEEGDEVIFPTPGFPAYESLTNFLDAHPVPIKLPQDPHFVLDPN